MHNLLAFTLSGIVFSFLGVGSASAQEAADVDAGRRERVIAAISNAQRFLQNNQTAGGIWLSSQSEVGVCALATLALLNSGVPPENEHVAKSLQWMRRQNDPDRTYDIAMVIQALAAADDIRDQGRLARLAAKLEDYQQGGDFSGAWGYDGGEGWWDMSNTQFAVLGLREAAYAGVPISRETWERSQQLLLRTQIGNVDSPQGAGWAYQGAGDSPTGSMTVAGIASLSIATAMLHNDQKDTTEDGRILCCGKEDDPAEKALEAGTRWLARHFNVRENPGANAWKLYYLYGLERAGRFTGRRFFEDHDWYREGVDFLIEGQNPRDGSWISETERDQVIATSFCLLFLSKGLSPVLVNKLQYGPRDPADGKVLSDDWNQHTRDVTNLVDFIDGLPKWPKLLTWQVVDLRTAAEGEGVAALLQAPVQFMSGSDSPDSIQGRELALLREYISQGGFLFAVQNCESADFETGFRDLVRRLFDGQYELKKLPPTHDVYRSEFLFAENPPELWGVDFGCRTAIIYAPFDHGCRWQKWMKHDPQTRHPNIRTQIAKSMQLGTNVIAYATGREVHDKLDRPDVLAALDENRINRGRLSIARLRHTGGWDTAPYALKRLQRELQEVGIESSGDTPNIPATDPALFDYPLLYTHGRKNFQFSDAEREKLKQYLENGGFLFADASCGATQFDKSFHDMVQQTFGKPLEKIPVEHELFKNDFGYDIQQVRRRLPPANARGSSLASEESVGEPLLEGLEIDGRYVIVYSKYDLSCALERQATSACAGYPGDDAAKIGVNIVLYGLLQ